MVHLSKLCCYSNRWFWVRFDFADVLKIEKMSEINNSRTSLVLYRVIVHW